VLDNGSRNSVYESTIDIDIDIFSSSAICVVVPTSAMEPLMQLDLESGTICWRTSGSFVMQPFQTVIEDLFGQWDQTAV